MPRPTIKFLQSLPIESFTDSLQRDQIARRQWLDLEFYEIRHPLMDDARLRFGGGRVPDRHRSSSKAAGRPVFELRDTDGAAWRGAAVLDDAGDPWLVFAEKHNRFHDRAAEVLKVANQDGYLPLPVELKLRDREEAARADRDWRAGLLLSLVVAIDDALNSGRQAVARLPERPGSTAECDVLVELEHDASSADEIKESGQASTLVSVDLKFPSKPDYPLRDAAIQEIVAFLGPGSVDAVYGSGGELHTFLTISHAKLAQLVAARIATGMSQVSNPALAQPPTCLHYVGARYLTEAFVYGKSVRAVCGTWFVPTCDESVGLPVCRTCETERPVAQAVVDLIERQLSGE